MKQLFLIAAMLFSATMSFAQKQMKDYWVAMPDSVVPYLNKTKRTEMVDFYQMGVKAETFNLLQGATTLDSLTATFADVTLNPTARIQLSLLPTTGGDTLICMSRTYYGEAPETTVSFYDSQWRPIPSAGLLPTILPESLVQRPDTMTVERYDDLFRLVDPMMTYALMSSGGQELTFILSTPMVTKKEKMALEAILVQRKLKWDGEKFN
ncbi:MAG: DUF3256 family protein [Prevotella sp.]|nr:DUF3256 family protein [Prevotella sp.]